MVVGLRPSVAVTLVELGLTMPGIHTALIVDKGLAARPACAGVPDLAESDRSRTWQVEIAGEEGIVAARQPARNTA